MSNQYFQCEPGEDEIPISHLSINTETGLSVKETNIGRFFKIIGATVVAFAFFILITKDGNKLRDANGFGSKQQSLDSSSSFSVEIEVESPGYDALESLSMLPWDAIAEPARVQYISVSSFILDDVEIDVDSGSYAISWTLGDGTTLTGQSASFQIDNTGIYDCTVTISQLERRRLDSTSSTVSTSSGPVKPVVSSDSTTTTTTTGGTTGAITTGITSGVTTGTTTFQTTTMGTGSDFGVFIPSTDTDTDADSSSDTSSTSDASSTTTSSRSDSGSSNVASAATISSSTASVSSATSTSASSASGTGPVKPTTDTTDTTTTTTASTFEATDANGDIIVNPIAVTTPATTPTSSVETIIEEVTEVVTATYTYSFTLAVKYVRREIRAMSDGDRGTFLDALYQMYTLEEAAGKAKYGDKFNTAEYYVYKHLNGAGTTDCDHWHDGAGIVTHHMAFTLQVEQTLQAIDPSVSMPYWEYGMDSYLYTNWWDSPLFDSDWFGEANPKNDDHIIDDGGMWVGIEMPDGSPYMDWSIAETGSLNPFVNAFGHMRSPWNNNPVKGIGRHNQTYGMTQYGSMPLCSTLQSCFKSTTMADINDCLNGATHGPVHILIGGAWGEGTLFDDPDIEFAQMPDKLLFFKVLWRMGWTRCPSTCTFGQPCKCSVPDEYVNTYGAYYILESTNVLYALAKDLVDADDELYLKVLRAVEDPGIAGEMFSSAAAFDPTFWPLHGAAERLVDLKRIYVSQGEITNFDETWAYTTYNKASGAAYLNGVCDWSKVAGSGDLTLPTCTLDVICFGHNENDLMEFSGFLSTGDSYTNIDFYNFMHPWNDDLPYTYDTFDYDYCDDEGYPFDTSSDLDTVDPMGPPSGPTSNGMSGAKSSVRGSANLGGMGRKLGSSTGQSSSKEAIKEAYANYKRTAPRKSSRTIPATVDLTQPLAATKKLSDELNAAEVKKR